MSAGHGGTVEHPAELYRPGVGTCPICGQSGVPTHANGRLGEHGPTRHYGPQSPTPSYRTRTCEGWGEQAVVWDTRRL
jgi:hypothetical protein